MALEVPLEEELDIDKLLGRVSKKLGWLNIQENDTEATGKKPPENQKHKRKNKLLQGSLKKGKRKFRKDTSSSSDKENSVKGHSQHDLSASPRVDKGRSNRAQFLASPFKEQQTEENERSGRLSSPNGCISSNCCRADGGLQSLGKTRETCGAADKEGQHLAAQGAVFEAVCDSENECGNCDGTDTVWDLDSGGPNRCRQEEHSPNSSKVTPDAEGRPPEVRGSRAPQDEWLSSGDDNIETTASTCTKVPSSDDTPPASSDEKVGGSSEPFSPFVPYSETPEPIRWVLTPPPKEPGFKTKRSAEKIQMTIISDSDADSSDYSPSANHQSQKKEVSQEEFLSSYSPVSEVKNKGPDDLALDEDMGTAEQTETERSTGVEVIDLCSDSEQDRWAQAPSLRERLSKNFKKKKGLGKTTSGKEQLGDSPLVRGSSSDDGQKWKCDSGRGQQEDSASPKERSVLNSRVSRYNGSEEEDDDGDFEQFLQAIKTPRHASAQPQSPLEDEDQYENSFIDDTPIDEVDSDDDVYYYKHINSVQKIFRDQKKDTTETSTFSKHRLPKFSDSEDDLEDSVFATPKQPAIKQRNPKISTSSKKYTPVPSQRRDPATSSKTDFLSSLSTPRVGCASSSPFVRDFKRHRVTLTQKLFTIYNQTVFDNKLPLDFSIKWNNRLRKTAGYCYYTKTRLGGHRGARIELSMKVCDTAERLRDTLIHELCHASCWLVNGVNDGHGRFWKYWAAKANQAHPSIPVIKRCHSYEITTKYKYQCVTCKTTIGRHSKSINTAKFCCAYCKGSLVLLPSLDKDGKVAKARTPNRFAMFVKENYGPVKKENVSLKHAEIMRLLSQDFAKKATVST